MNKAPVIEIFKSIQGEGHFMGKVAVFVRFAGCNLSCPWCDTDCSPADTKVMSSFQIAEEVEYIRGHAELVVFTGGEPTLYNKVIEDTICILRSTLADVHMIYAIETNGTNQTPRNIDWVTCSPKPPLYKVHERLNPDEFKLVIDSTVNIEYVKMLIGNRLGMRQVWLQPESSNMPENFKRCYELAMDNPTFKVGVQLHKIVGVR